MGFGLEIRVRVVFGNAAKTLHQFLHPLIKPSTNNIFNRRTLFINSSAK